MLPAEWVNLPALAYAYRLVYFSLGSSAEVYTSRFLFVVLAPLSRDLTFSISMALFTFRMRVIVLDNSSSPFSPRSSAEDSLGTWNKTNSLDYWLVLLIIYLVCMRAGRVG